MASRNGHNPILKVDNLITRFYTPEGVVHAVNGVSFELQEGETLGVVGESGCGKSVTMLSILQLIQRPPGKIENGTALFHDKDLLGMNAEGIRQVRGGQIAMIFQDPMTSLNPVLTIERQISEPLMLHLGMNKAQARQRVIDLLQLVGIPEGEKRIADYPHQFSGGMRQRAMIAMALSCNPQILIADEPTTALDVTIQAQIVDLVKRLRDEFGMSIIWITHDLGVVARLAQRVIVMYAGRIVEQASVADIFERPCHPYTVGLLGSIPSDQAIREKSRLHEIKGMVPALTSMPLGCPFHPRCPRKMAVCVEETPGLFKPAAGRQVACWLYES